MMKKAFVLVLLAVLCLGARAAGYDYLVFTTTGGQTEVVASANLTMTFGDGNIYVTNGSDINKTYVLANLQKMEFSTDGTTAISTLSTDTLTIGQTTAVYDLNGRQMPSTTALPKGVYIVKTQNRTFKVQIR